MIPFFILNVYYLTESVSLLLLCSSVRWQKVVLHNHQKVSLIIVVCAVCRKAVCCMSSVGKTRPSCSNAITPARAGERAGTEWCRTVCGNNAFALPDPFRCTTISVLQHANVNVPSVFTTSFSLDSNYRQHVVCVCVSSGYDCKSFALLKWAGVWELCRIFLKEPSYASKAFKVLTSIKMSW